MKGAYNPEFDSPEARANFATRHIFNVYERKQKRDELLAKFLAEPVVNMFPGRGRKGDVGEDEGNASSTNTQPKTPTKTPD